MKNKQYNHNKISGCVTERENGKGTFRVLHCKQSKRKEYVKEEDAKWVTECLRHGKQIFTNNLRLSKQLVESSEDWCIGCFDIDNAGEKVIKLDLLRYNRFLYKYDKSVPLFLDGERIGDCVLLDITDHEGHWVKLCRLVTSYEIPSEHFLSIRFTGSQHSIYLTGIHFESSPPLPVTLASVKFEDCLYTAPDEQTTQRVENFSLFLSTL